VLGAALRLNAQFPLESTSHLNLQLTLPKLWRSPTLGLGWLVLVVVLQAVLPRRLGFNAPASRLKKSCRGLKSNFLSFHGVGRSGGSRDVQPACHGSNHQPARPRDQRSGWSHLYTRGPGGVALRHRNGNRLPDRRLRCNRNRTPHRQSSAAPFCDSGWLLYERGAVCAGFWCTLTNPTERTPTPNKSATAADTCNKKHETEQCPTLRNVHSKQAPCHSNFTRFRPKPLAVWKRPEKLASAGLPRGRRSLLNL